MMAPGSKGKGPVVEIVCWSDILDARLTPSKMCLRHIEDDMLSS